MASSSPTRGVIRARHPARLPESTARFRLWCWCTRREGGKFPASTTRSSPQRNKAASPTCNLRSNAFRNVWGDGLRPGWLRRSPYKRECLHAREERLLQGRWTRRSVYIRAILYDTVAPMYPRTSRFEMPTELGQALSGRLGGGTFRSSLMGDNLCRS